jgi:predicted nucleic acid-binding protein
LEIVIDSSVLIGQLVPNDVWHHQAAALWEAVQVAGHTAVYFDCIAAEAISAAVRRLYEKKLVAEVADLFEALESHVPLTTITWILPDAPRLYAAILELIRSTSGALNFNDALIALACQERGIGVIASFDYDFDQVSWLHRIAQPQDVSD